MEREESECLEFWSSLIVFQLVNRPVQNEWLGFLHLGKGIFFSELPTEE